MSVAPAPILYAIGSDRPETTADGRPKFQGTSDLHRLLGRSVPFHRMQVTRQIFRQNRRPELNYRVIVNFITDPDQNPRVLDNLKKLLRDFPGTVINRPESMLRSTREQVARVLTGIPGLIVPKAIRVRTANAGLTVGAAMRAGLAFPVIVRLAGTHSGRIVGLFNSPDEMRSGLGEGGDLIITEFIDFKSLDGLYRKYRFFFIGRHIIFRHMLVSDYWNVHAKDRMRFMVERPELLAEEAELFKSPEAPLPPDNFRTLEAIRDRMSLDYFGMDCGVMPDGRLVLFEANATMSFFPFLDVPEFNYVRQCLAPAQRAFRELLGLAPAKAALRAAS